jgi:hypothetical protein
MKKSREYRAPQIVDLSDLSLGAFVQISDHRTKQRSAQKDGSAGASPYRWHQLDPVIGRASLPASHALRIWLLEPKARVV